VGPTRQRVRERGRGTGEVGRMGRKRDLGRGGGRKEGEVRWAAGGLGCFVFFLFFLSFFKSISNQFFKPFFLNQIFYIFSNSNFNANSPTILKAFLKLFLTTFQTCFKFKLSSFF
jgi:hypothetical protein